MSSPRSASFSPCWLPVGIIILVVFKNWLLEAQPIIATMGWPYDHTHFINQATSILSGQWLGEFSFTTLIKGPVYPLWIAFNHVIGLDIIHTTDLLYMAACLTVMLAARPVVSNRFVLLLIFALLYLSPNTYNYQSVANTMRMTIYPAFALLSLGALLGMVTRLLVWQRIEWKWMMLFGVAFSLFWYTREEGIFLVPSVLLVLVTALFYVWLPGFDGARLRATAALAIPPLFIIGSVTGLFIYLNETHYGAPYVIETKTDNHMRAQNAFLRVKPDKWKRYHELEPAQRERIFAASSKAAELGPSFSGHGYFEAAMSSWAIREAVNNAGYYDKGAAAVDAFYDEMASQVEAACENGRLECQDLLFPGMPAWRPVFTQDFPGQFVKELKEVIRFKVFTPYIDNVYSFGDRNYRHYHDILTHSRSRLIKGEVASEVNFHSGLQAFKLDVLAVIGKVHQKLRPVLFYMALLVLLWLTARAIAEKRFDLTIVFGYAIIGALISLTLILTIISVAVYQDSFRASHAAIPLTSMLTVVMLIAYQYRSGLLNQPDAPDNGSGSNDTHGVSNGEDDRHQH